MDYYESMIKQKLHDLITKGVSYSEKKFNHYKGDYWVQTSILNVAEKLEANSF